MRLYNIKVKTYSTRFSMDIQVFFSSINRRKALRRYVQMKMKKVLGKHSPAIHHGTVRIRDVNGDRGGVDKECTVILETKPAGTVVVRSVDADAGQAFRSVLKRLRTSLRDKLNQSQSPNKRKRREIRSFKYA